LTRPILSWYHPKKTNHRTQARIHPTNIFITYYALH
jgi:hypothetical protein